MKKEIAKRKIIDEWLKLPEEERKTDNQAFAFALKIKLERPDLMRFRSSADKIQIIGAWLRQTLPLDYSSLRNKESIS